MKDLSEHEVGSLVLDNRYQLIRQIKGSIGSDRVFTGKKGACRYCFDQKHNNFKNRAHTFPEALGNKWVYSLDECDSCNKKFSTYDDALTRSVLPFLTLGGVKGKDNKIRQTGKTEGGTVISRREGNKEQIPNLSFKSEIGDSRSNISVDTNTGTLGMAMPVADVFFKPRHAYKALTKMAFALLPDSELKNYEGTRKWLLDVNDQIDFPHLETALSFSSIGSSPQLVVGSLLRRTVSSDMVPHILFIFCAGSICFQIDLRSDQLEDHLPPVFPGSIKIKWCVEVGDIDRKNTLIFEYGDPIHFNWSSAEASPSLIESITTKYCPETLEGSFNFHFRQQHLYSMDIIR